MSTTDFDPTHSIGNWLSFPGAGGWGPYGAPFQTPQYRVVGDVVEGRGLLLATSGAGALLGTFPVGARPAASEVLSVGKDGAMVRVDITSAGALSLAGGAPTVGAFVSLAGLRFFLS